MRCCEVLCWFDLWCSYTLASHLVAFINMGSESIASVIISLNRYHPLCGRKCRWKSFYFIDLDMRNSRCCSFLPTCCSDEFNIFPPTLSARANIYTGVDVFCREIWRALCVQFPSIIDEIDYSFFTQTMKGVKGAWQQQRWKFHYRFNQRSGRRDSLANKGLIVSMQIRITSSIHHLGF